MMSSAVFLDSMVGWNIVLFSIFRLQLLPPRQESYASNMQTLPWDLKLSNPFVMDGFSFFFRVLVYVIHLCRYACILCLCRCVCRGQPGLMLGLTSRLSVLVIDVGVSQNQRSLICSVLLPGLIWVSLVSAFWGCNYRQAISPGICMRAWGSELWPSHLSSKHFNSVPE